MTARSIRGAAAAALVTALSLTAAACSNPDSPKGGGSGAGSTSAVVGIAYEPDSLSPLLGYGKDGNSKIFDGLLALDEELKL
ncbi:ABC transporter substrate-binding protein, partial [Streptomyces sp. DSM 41528]|nr:ABC transporter substrate-binding protein [Streptomyces sp. DSM 41528]